LPWPYKGTTNHCIELYPITLNFQLQVTEKKAIEKAFGPEKPGLLYRTNTLETIQTNTDGYLRPQAFQMSTCLYKKAVLSPEETVKLRYRQFQSIPTTRDDCDLITITSTSLTDYVLPKLHVISQPFSRQRFFCDVCRQREGGGVKIPPGISQVLEHIARNGSNGYPTFSGHAV